MGGGGVAVFPAPGAAPGERADVAGERPARHGAGARVGAHELQRGAVRDGGLQQRGHRVHRVRAGPQHAGRVRAQPAQQPRLRRHLARGRLQHPHGVQPRQRRRLQEPALHRQHQRGVPRRAQGPGRLQQPLHRL